MEIQSQLKEFYQWLQLNKNSTKTIQSYYQMINCFGKFCNYKFTQDNLNKYLIKLKEENKSINSINLFKNAFINYCKFANLKLNIPSPKRVKRKGIKFYFTEKDMEKIYKITPRLPLFNYKFLDLLFKFMFYTGVRPSELINLKVSNINFEKRNIFISDAKRNKDRIIPIMNNKLYNELKNHCNNKSITENVFNITYSQISYLTKHVKKLLNIQEKIEPRTFRISFAKYCLSKRMSDFYLKLLMGHDDIKITEMYANPTEKEVKNYCELIRLNQIDMKNDELNEAKKTIKELQKTITELNKIIKDLRKEK